MSLPRRKNPPRTDRTSKSNVNCCVSGCNSVRSRNPDLTFHSFPTVGQKIRQNDLLGNELYVERRQLWLDSLQMHKAVSPHTRICSRHFADTDYITPDKGKELVPMRLWKCMTI